MKRRKLKKELRKRFKLIRQLRKDRDALIAALHTSGDFKPGTVVVFDQHAGALKGLTEEERIRYYGPLGYGKEKPTLFSYVCPILDSDGAGGHCVLVSLEDGHLEVMRHPNDFRPATEDEF